MVLHLYCPGGGTSQFAPRNQSCIVIPWTTADSSDRAKDPSLSDRHQADGAYWLFGSQGFWCTPRMGGGGEGYYYDLRVTQLTIRHNAF